MIISEGGGEGRWGEGGGSYRMKLSDMVEMVLRECVRFVHSNTRVDG